MNRFLQSLELSSLLFPYHHFWTPHCPDVLTATSETNRSRSPQRKHIYGVRAMFPHQHSGNRREDLQQYLTQMRFRVALWERKRSVVIPLGLLALAHWILLYRTMFVVRAVWDDNLSTCVVASTNSSLLNITFFFSTNLFLSRNIMIYI